MSYGSSDKLGAVLVIERRRCRGVIRNELGELQPCGAVYDTPAKKLAQLHRTPYDRSEYSIEAITEADQTLGYPYKMEQPVIGKHRTVYIQESSCDWCQVCYRPTIEWDTIHRMELPEEVRTIVKLETPETYAAACSHRDQLRNQYEEAKAKLKAAKAHWKQTQDAFHLACDTVHACSRYYYYDTVKKTYLERPSVKLNASAKVKPMKLADI